MWKIVRLLMAFEKKNPGWNLKHEILIDNFGGIFEEITGWILEDVSNENIGSNPKKSDRRIIR